MFEEDVVSAFKLLKGSFSAQETRAPVFSKVILPKAYIDPASLVIYEDANYGAKNPGQRMLMAGLLAGAYIHRTINPTIYKGCDTLTKAHPHQIDRDFALEMFPLAVVESMVPYIASWGYAKNAKALIADRIKVNKDCKEVLDFGPLHPNFRKLLENIVTVVALIEAGDWHQTDKKDLAELARVDSATEYRELCEYLRFDSYLINLHGKLHKITARHN